MKTIKSNLLLAVLLCLGLAASAQTRGKLPSQITTLDGRVYTGVAEEPVSVWPDGVVIHYQPSVRGEAVPGALGEAKLKFRDLPDEVRNLFHYDLKSAAEFETQQGQALSQWWQAQAVEERALQRYRNLAEVNRGLAGNDDTSYSVSLDAAGKVTAHGFTRTVPTINSTNVSLPPYTWLGYRNSLQTDYMPVPAAPYNSGMMNP
jgi:hypothetical protein